MQDVKRPGKSASFCQKRKSNFTDGYFITDCFFVPYGLFCWLS
jgi:hypothetical protein